MRSCKVHVSRMGSEIRCSSTCTRSWTDSAVSIVRLTTIIQTCVASPETHSMQCIQYPRFAVSALVDHDAAWFGGILPAGGESIGCAEPPAYPVSARSVGPWSEIEDQTIGPGQSNRRS